jgi:protein O-GlcNAc transferase
MTRTDDDPQALHDRGVSAGMIGQHALAVDLIRRAVDLSPKVARYHLNLGFFLDKLGRPDQALAAYRTALLLEPDYAGARANLADALTRKAQARCDAHEYDQALAELDEALALLPNFAAAHVARGNALMKIGRLDDALAAFKAASDIEPQNVTAASNRLFLLQFHPGYDAKAILHEHLLSNQRFKTPVFSHANDPSPDRPLRIGYLSPHLCGHCVAMFMAPLLSRHDHQKFKVYCYADVAHPDSVTARLRAYPGVWHSIAGMSDADVAAKIHADRIDILVDIAMHMGNSRPLVMARKPAPVLVAWLAYPGTTGIAAIDYRLTDPYLDPPGTDDCYSEQSVRLPDTFWCYDPLILHVGPPLAPGPLPALRNGHVTFGCLNNFCKINDAVLTLWSRVLNGVPQSRLRLLAPVGSARQYAIQKLQSHGVDATRVDFVPMQSRRDYMTEYQRIDVCLDTLPYNGHTTSLDAVWMGVPVITRVGTTVVGRAGWCLLSNLKLTELAARDDDQFVNIAIQLAGDLPRLAELRQTLRQRMEHSPLCDASRFTLHMEAALRQMWRNWCRAR